MGEEVWKGRIVFYRVGSVDSDNMKHNQAEVLPAIVVQVWTKECVNLQVFCDGPVGTEWKTSVVQGTEPGQWDFYQDQANEPS